MTGAARAPGAIALGALAGASIWVSWGTVALTHAEPVSRVGVLPALWLLPALAVGVAALVAVARVRLSYAWPLSLTALLWLPWLPLRVPAAFLLWDGPIEWLVWMAALGGVAAAWAVDPRARDSDAHSIPAIADVTDLRSGSAGHDAERAAGHAARHAACAAGVAALCFVLAGAWVQPQIPSGDEPHYLVIAQSLLLDRDLRIENNHARRDYEAYVRREIAPDYLRRGQDGEIYSIHAPGLSVLVLPAFALLGYAGALVTVALFAGAGTGLAWHAAWMVTRDRMSAWIGWAAVALSVPVFFHGFTIYPDGAGAVNRTGFVGGLIP